MKFGKYIQKRQLDLPDYAASFVDYKALKKLIKKLSATPVLSHAGPSDGVEPLDAQAALQANKLPFFFRLDRELDKVNKFYVVKEEELKTRLPTLLAKKQALQTRASTFNSSKKYQSLEEGLRQFTGDLNKLQQFVEINATAFSKILKKWDKASKSRTKELYLSRAVEVQPVFNRDVIKELSDQATAALLELADLAERLQTTTPSSIGHYDTSDQEEDVIDSEVLHAVNAGDVSAVSAWISRTRSVSSGTHEHVTRAFFSAIDEAPESTLCMLLETELVDLNQVDDINNRNCLHKAAIAGLPIVLRTALSRNVDPRVPDIYGRIPLHYACMYGRPNMIEELVSAAPETVDLKDLNGFTPLLHAIQSRNVDSDGEELPILGRVYDFLSSLVGTDHQKQASTACAQFLLTYEARIEPESPTDHIPLNVACQQGSVPMVKLLLQGRPQILADAEGLYPQHLVARTGVSPQLLLTLRDYGVDLNQPDKLYQWTPLIHAANEGHIECLRILVLCGVNVDAVDEKGFTARYYAGLEGREECMRLLASAGHDVHTEVSQPLLQGVQSSAPSTTSPAPMAMEVDGIPDLSLPPPIIPVRRYGHNFLDEKTLVVINIGGTDAIWFYDQQYPAARLAISPKSSDLIPRNISLPIQDENKVISFEIDDLDTFALDFEIFAPFGSKANARAMASTEIFSGKLSRSGYWCAELQDARMQSIGRIRFKFQIIKPFLGTPLEITHFATYWKATSQIDAPNTLITGSSLSGEYIRLFVQFTKDGVPVLYSQWEVDDGGEKIPVMDLTYRSFARIGARHGSGEAILAGVSNAFTTTDATDVILQVSRRLASGFVPLRDALAVIPAEMHVELHVLCPDASDLERLQLEHRLDVNKFIDALLTVVFDHARQLRQTSDGFVRSVVFSSYNPDICTTLNWKQPNYPVLLCNDLFASATTVASISQNAVQHSGRTGMSVKKAVDIAKDNNFMGIICNSQLLDFAHGLIQYIKTAGLVLIVDAADTPTIRGAPIPASALQTFYGVPDGVDGFLRGNGVLKFNDSIDM